MSDDTASWAQLYDQTGYRPLALELTFNDFKAELDQYEITHPFFGPIYQRTVDVVIRMAFTGQAETARSLVPELAKLAHEIAATPAGTALDRLGTTNYGAVALLLLQDGMEWEPLDRTEASVILNRLPGIAQFTEEGRTSSILACMAFGLAENASTLARGQTLDPFVSALLANQTQVARLWPAWRDRFPTAYAANTVFWHQLLFVIRLLSPRDANPADWLRVQVG